MPKFQAIENLLKTPNMLKLVTFYREFTCDREALPMLWHFANFGDENLLLYKLSDRSNIPSELLEREKHKYDLYYRYDQIVFNENVIEIGGMGGGQGGSTIDIDWS